MLLVFKLLVVVERHFINKIVCKVLREVLLLEHLL